MTSYFLIYIRQLGAYLCCRLVNHVLVWVGYCTRIKHRLAAMLSSSYIPPITMNNECPKAVVGRVGIRRNHPAGGMMHGMCPISRVTYCFRMSLAPISCSSAIRDLTVSYLNGLGKKCKIYILDILHFAYK